MSEPKRTPLAAVHEAAGAKMVDFAGWYMPVSYSGIMDEHTAVRERVGLFDVSHMGEFVVTGAGANAFVNGIITNDCSKLAPGQLRYTVMCRKDGTVVDDLLAFVVDDNRMILVVNASNIDKDFEHVRTFDATDCQLDNASDNYALLAVQGPKARDVLKSCDLFSTVGPQLDEAAYYSGFTFDGEGGEVIVSRTGYTGELGFELFVKPDAAPAYWEAIMAAGAKEDIRPVGLGARDTLRFEASFCLYGHELDDETSPLEAGLGWVVKLKKENFHGQQALREQKKNGIPRKLIGLELEGRNIARQGFNVLRNGETVGKVTSGTFSPTLGKSLAMAMIDRGAAEAGAAYEVEARNKTVSAAHTALPFYPSRSK